MQPTDKELADALGTMADRMDSVAKIWGGPTLEFSIAWAKELRAIVAALRTARQVRSLEPFREAVNHWRRDLVDDFKNGHMRDAAPIVEADRLLSLIDGKVTPAPASETEITEFDRIEFALRDAGFGYDEAFRIAHMATNDKVREFHDVLRGKPASGEGQQGE